MNFVIKYIILSALFLVTLILGMVRIIPPEYLFVACLPQVALVSNINNALWKLKKDALINIVNSPEESAKHIIKCDALLQLNTAMILFNLCFVTALITTRLL